MRVVQRSWWTAVSMRVHRPMSSVKPTKYDAILAASKALVLAERRSLTTSKVTAAKERDRCIEALADEIQDAFLIKVVPCYRKGEG